MTALLHKLDFLFRGLEGDQVPGFFQTEIVETDTKYPLPKELLPCRNEALSTKRK